MAWNTRVNWTTGQIPSAADFNAPGLDVRNWGGPVNANANRLDQLAGLTAPTQPRAQVRNSVALSIPNNTWTILTWDTDEIGVGGVHQDSTAATGFGPLNARLTALYTGLHLVSGAVGFAVNATGYRGVRLTLTSNSGASTVAQALLPATSYYTILGLPTALVQLNAGDGVVLEALQSSGGALNTDGLLLSFFAMAQLF